MNFSKDWEEAYKNNTHQSIWPWSDLVSYVMRYCRPFHEGYRILELGCGAGANIPFLLSLGIDYYGVDGSETVIKMLKDKFPDLKDKLKVADFTQEIPFEGKFDLIIDRASLTHNKTEVIEECIKSVVNSALLPKGKFIGIDWFSTEHDDYIHAKKDIDDPYTVTSFSQGQFEGIGVVHFSDQMFIQGLFGNLEILEHKVYQKVIPDHHVFASWNFLAVKE